MLGIDWLPSWWTGENLLRAVPQLCGRSVLAGASSALSWGSHREQMFLQNNTSDCVQRRRWEDADPALVCEDELQCTLTEGWEMCLGFQKCSDVLAVLPEAAGKPGGPGGAAGVWPWQLILCLQSSWCWSAMAGECNNQTGLPGHLLQNKFSRPRSTISRALRSSDCWCRMTPNFRVLGSWSKWVSVFTTKTLSC